MEREIYISSVLFEYHTKYPTLSPLCAFEDES